MKKYVQEAVQKIKVTDLKVSNTSQNNFKSSYKHIPENA